MGKNVERVREVDTGFMGEEFSLKLNRDAWNTFSEIGGKEEGYSKNEKLYRSGVSGRVEGV